MRDDSQPKDESDEDAPDAPDAAADRGDGDPDEGAAADDAAAAEDGADDEDEADDKDEGKDADAAKDPAPAKKKSGPSGKALGLLGFILALGAGFWVGQRFQGDDGGFAEVAAGPRLNVKLRGDEPQVGPDDAPVTIIEFADYQCPYCQKGHEPLMEAVEDFDEDVRLIYKHLPLPFHGKAMPAAKAAWAAHRQGKFWEFHDAMFDSKSDISGLEALVAKHGLDATQFKADMASPDASKSIDDDMKAAAVLAIRGTPAFVVNGHHYRGMRTLAQWKKIIKAERELVEDLDLPRGQAYAKLMEDALTERSPEPAKRRPGPDPSKRYKVTPDDRPGLGANEALVTIVLFSDFQCPYCARIGPVMHDLVERNDDVRVVFRNFPLGNHKQARPAAKAALAAGRQGQFWEMHDLLFSRRKEIPELARDNFTVLAVELSLDLDQFAADYRDPTLDQQINEDQRVARRFAVGGTPAGFINGRFIDGARDLEGYEALVETERAEAVKLIEAGTPRASVLDAVLASAESRVTVPKKEG